MKRIVISVIVCLTLSVFFTFSLWADDVLKDCNPSGTTVMGIGDIAACTIDPVADTDFFRFTGSAGQTFRITLAETGGGFSAAPCLELFDPDEISVDAWCAQNTGVSRQITLAKTGTYTVLVYESGDDQTVVYNLGLSCISGICPPPQPPSPFEDVPRSHPRFDDIIAIYNAGITTGCAQNPLRFCPQDPVTRAQMAAFIIRALEGEPPDNLCASGSPFPDVDPNLNVCKYIKRLSERGITTGFPDGTYRPANLVTRAQMAIFIIRALEGDPPDNLCATGSPFPDVAANSPTCKYIKRFFELGITTGFSDGTYRPNITITRAQMAAFLARAFLNMD